MPKVPKGKTILYTYIDKDLKRELQFEALRQDKKTLSDLVEDVMKRYMQKRSYENKRYGEQGENNDNT